MSDLAMKITLHLLSEWNTGRLNFNTSTQDQIADMVRKVIVHEHVSAPAISKGSMSDVLQRLSISDLKESLLYEVARVLISMISGRDLVALSEIITAIGKRTLDD